MVGGAVGARVPESNSQRAEIFTTALLPSAHPAQAPTVPVEGIVTERLLLSSRRPEQEPPEIKAPPETSKRYLFEALEILNVSTSPGTYVSVPQTRGVPSLLKETVRAVELIAGPFIPTPPTTRSALHAK